jgi:hypothetical protein
MAIAYFYNTWLHKNQLDKRVIDFCGREEALAIYVVVECSEILSPI